MLRSLSFASVLAFGLAAKQASAETFEVRRAADDVVVLTGELAPTPTTNGQPSAKLADFSALTEPGEYYLEVASVGKSVAFRVGDDVYDGELAKLMLGFYGWRSGIDIAFDFDGVHYQHSAGHLKDGLLDYIDGQVGVTKDGTGGWYDAGDYGKYLPTASESVGNMLAAWELFSDRLQKLELPYLPEHGSGIPDFLSELKWELDWMLKMQYDDASGRIHHKLNSPQFPGFILPAADTSKRYFASYSTAATAEFVATLAKAARAFAPYDALTGGYSKVLLDAAQRSYAYLLANPVDVQYDASVLAAGTYQKMGADDRLWAAAEMWETTGDPIALADVEQRIGARAMFVANFDWDNMTTFGLVTYLLSQREGRDPAIVERLLQNLTNLADGLVYGAGQNAYGRDLDSYYWGSNGVIARSCVMLQTAYRVVAPKPEFLDVCAAQVGYLYGRNQYNRSQVTGAGVDPPLHPHARISGSDDVDAPYPGLLVGGGQSASNWQDAQSNFQTNEIAINWNAALVYALAGFISDKGAAASPARGALPAGACQVRVNSVGYLPERSKVATVVSDCTNAGPDFQCSVTDKTLSGDTSGALSIIDDLEDGDTRATAKRGRSGAWFSYDDGSAGTRTQAEIKSAGRAGSKNAICISGQGFTGWGGGMGVSLAGEGSSRMLYDASPYTGVSFWARGSGMFRAMLVDKYSDPAASLCTSCYDHFQAPFTPGSEWKQYTFSWKDLKQLGFGEMKPNVCAAGLYALQFQWSGSQPFELCLDDVAFTQAAGSSDSADSPSVSPRGGGCGCRIGVVSESPAFAELGVLALGLTAVMSRRRRAARASASRRGS
ncbi:MAG TPA: glycoside hydrolase family 9 protein [Polyangiaceae bacterium]|nr:glycoside hydrolase family 9 protein [Polyangiaceae bacterium]